MYARLGFTRASRGHSVMTGETTPPLDSAAAAGLYIDDFSIVTSYSRFYVVRNIKYYLFLIEAPTANDVDVPVRPDPACRASRKTTIFPATPIVIVSPARCFTIFLFHFLARASIKTIFRRPIKRAPSTRRPPPPRHRRGCGWPRRRRSRTIYYYYYITILYFSNVPCGGGGGWPFQRSRSPASSRFFSAHSFVFAPPRFCTSCDRPHAQALQYRRRCASNNVTCSSQRQARFRVLLPFFIRWPKFFSLLSPSRNDTMTYVVRYYYFYRRCGRRKPAQVDLHITKLQQNI